MGGFIKRNKVKSSVNKSNCDIWYSRDKEIEIDSAGYYNKLIKKGEFYKRPITKKINCKISSDEIKQLKLIKGVFNKHKTKYKIVISPIYDQVKMEKKQVELLEDIFGDQNVFNFSGKNTFTNSVYNFYESSHYRPHVANEIMKIIYK